MKFSPRSCEDADDPPLSDLGGFPIESAGLWVGGKTTMGCS